MDTPNNKEGICVIQETYSWPRVMEVISCIQKPSKITRLHPAFYRVRIQDPQTLTLLRPFQKKKKKTNHQRYWIVKTQGRALRKTRQSITQTLSHLEQLHDHQIQPLAEELRKTIRNIDIRLLTLALELVRGILLQNNLLKLSSSS